MFNVGKSILCFCLAYALMILMIVLHTIFNIKVLKMKPVEEESLGEGFEKTIKLFPFYTFIIFVIFGYTYDSSLIYGDIVKALICSCFWLVLSIILDIISWFLIRYFWEMSLQELIDSYKKWMFSIYIAAFLGPIIGWIFLL